MWKYSKADNPTVLVLVPTRELVVQVTEILENLTENMTARVIGVYGGKISILRNYCLTMAAIFW